MDHTSRTAEQRPACKLRSASPISHVGDATRPRARSDTDG